MPDRTAGITRWLIAALAAAVAVLLAGSGAAHAATTVSLSFSRVLVTVNPSGTSNITIFQELDGTVTIADTAGVMASPDLETGACTPDTGIVPSVRCNLQSRVTIDVFEGTSKAGVDSINASASPRKLWLGVSTPTQTRVSATGSPFNDTINGGPGDDVIHGGAGPDTITGLGGADQLTGDAGDDQLKGGTGADGITGGGDRDTVLYDDHAASVNVTVGSGAGNDGSLEDGPAGARDSVTETEVVIGTPAADSLTGDASNNQLVGGGGDDTLLGGAGDDTLNGGAGTDTASYADHGAGVVVNLTDEGTDGAAGEADTLEDISDLVGGSGSDTLAGDEGVNRIAGGPGGDIVIGGPGPDRLFGDAGGDDMRARDNEIDTVDCGPDPDKAALDDIDLATNCDDSTITVVDQDRDGAPKAVDCDDLNPSIHPGAVDIPGDGIDQNCADGDARVDADGDGVFRELDCNDADAAIRPGLPEIPGNAVDENCDGVVTPFPKLDVGFSFGYKNGAGFTKITTLAVRAPAGSTARATCKPPRAPAGAANRCPFKKRTRTVGARRRVAFTRAFAGRKLLPGTIVALRVTKAGARGKLATFKIRRNKVPKDKTVCVDPGGAVVAC
jgi:Ca2+-binding RTX toxin-like protein